jgi:hypothetical protein
MYSPFADTVENFGGRKNALSQRGLFCEMLKQVRMTVMGFLCVIPNLVLNLFHKLSIISVSRIGFLVSMFPFEMLHRRVETARIREGEAQGGGC